MLATRWNTGLSDLNGLVVTIALGKGGDALSKSLAK